MVYGSAPVEMLSMYNPCKHLIGGGVIIKLNLASKESCNFPFQVRTNDIFTPPQLPIISFQTYLKAKFPFEVELAFCLCSI